MGCARRQQREGVLRLRSHHEWFLEPRPEDWWHREELELKIIIANLGKVRWRGSLPRPVFTASRPSQTMARIGPLSMSKNIMVNYIPNIERGKSCLRFPLSGGMNAYR